MNLKKLLASVFGGFVVLSTLAPNHVSGELVGAYFDITNGYRQDNFSTKLLTTNVANSFREENKLKIDNVAIYQLGGKAEIDLCGFFARGEMYWGWSDSGKFKEASRFFNEKPSKSKAGLRKGRTKDYVVGGGYYLSFCGFEIGPSGGWSYQYQSFKVKNARFQGVPDPLLNGLQFSNTWEGPWAGVDARWDFCGFQVRSGYSYYWATWKGKWLLRDNKHEGVSFTETCKGNDAYGQSAYIDTVWNLLPFVELGLSFKWQQWIARKGKEKISKFDKMAQGWKMPDRVKHATWDSYAVSLILGVNF